MERTYIYSNKEEALQWYLHVAEFKDFRKTIVTGYSPFSKATVLDAFKRDAQSRASASTQYVGSCASSGKGLAIVGPDIESEKYFFKWSELAPTVFENYARHNKQLPHSFMPECLNSRMSANDRLAVGIQLVQEHFCSEYFCDLGLSLADVEKLSANQVLEKIKTLIEYTNKDGYEVLNLTTGKTRQLPRYDKSGIDEHEIIVFRLYDPQSKEVVGVYSVSAHDGIVFYQGDEVLVEENYSLSFENLSLYKEDLISLLNACIENIRAFYVSLTQEGLLLRTRYANQMSKRNKSIEWRKQSFLATLESVNECSEVSNQHSEDASTPILKEVKTNKNKASRKKDSAPLIILKEIKFPRSGIIQMSFL